MANFEIVEQEGVRLVRITLENETVRTESGALYYMRGPITMESKGPSMGGLLKAMATGESIFRPTYTGTGELFLEPSFGGFHVFDVAGRTWILEDGAYWASEAGVNVEAFREKALTAFKSGEGFMDFQTKISGGDAYWFRPRARWNNSGSPTTSWSSMASTSSHARARSRIRWNDRRDRCSARSPPVKGW